MYSSTKSSLVLGGIASTRLMTIIDEIGRINRLIELSEERVHIPADTRSAFPVISVQSPVSIQCCWQS